EPKKHGEHFLLTSLGVSRPFGEWTVAALSNIADERKHLSLNLPRDLRLPSQRRAVYDFWNHQFLGIFQDTIELDIDACDTRVLRLTPIADDMPALISTSRHITQGAYELLDLQVSKTSIGGRLLCAPGENTVITILLPEGCKQVAASHPFQRNERLLELQIQAESPEPVTWNATL
ncbi:MAG: hypothetical protein IJJ26_14135, partial [Victivallales bacterium]|nr:hypothetical protein [Victivallales bacterium]